MNQTTYKMYVGKWTYIQCILCLFFSFISPRCDCI